MNRFDVNLIHAGRTLGMSEITIFWKVVVPAAGPGILSGTILTFARALGEYGATSMLAGNIPGKQERFHRGLPWLSRMETMRRQVSGLQS